MSQLREYAYLRLDPCAYCGRPAGGTIDHIVGLAVGGTPTAENLTGACRACNEAKGRRWPMLVLLLLRGWVTLSAPRERIGT
jgi:5-methylcytosine-specific restriction endonuclease McrA